MQSNAEFFPDRSNLVIVVQAQLCVHAQLCRTHAGRTNSGRALPNGASYARNRRFPLHGYREGR